MTDVVTNTAAYAQPLLFANRQQSLGIPNPESPQVALAISEAASLQQQALLSTQVAPSSDDRASLKQNNDDGHSSPDRSFAHQLPTSSLAAKPAEIAPPTTGPAKARVDIPVFDITALAAAPALAAPAVPLTSAAATAPASDATKPLTLSNLTGGAAGPLQQHVTAPAPKPAEHEDAPRPQTSGVLGPAAEVKDADLENISANIFGAAFAPTQVLQPTATQTPTQTQKNFIFAQRKLYAGEDVVAQPTGKFTSDDAKAAARGLGPDAVAGRFAVQPAAIAAATAGAQFAASADTAQKLFDKVPTTASGAPIDATTGEVRLYDKVSQTDTQGHSGKYGDSTPGDDTLDSRESLYQRAQAVAQALGDKSSNPAVKKLVATLESYALVTGITSGASSGRPTVRVIA